MTPGQFLVHSQDLLSAFQSERAFASEATKMEIGLDSALAPPSSRGGRWLQLRTPLGE